MANGGTFSSLAQWLGGVADTLPAEIRSALVVCGIEASRVMSQTISDMHAVRTGATKGSVYPVMVGDDTVTVGPTTSYAPMIEYGTGRMAARPFAQVTAQTMQQVGPELIRRALAAALR
jgi:hypothetical protein